MGKLLIFPNQKHSEQNVKGKKNRRKISCKIKFINVCFVKMCATQKNAQKKVARVLFAGEGVGGSMPATKDTEYCTCRN